MSTHRSSHGKHRILHVISSLEGGAGLGALEIVNRLVHHDHLEVMLCVLGNPLSGPLIANEIQVEFLQAPVHIRSTSIRRHRELRRLVAEWKPDLVHSHLWPSAIAVGLSLPSTLPHLIHIRDTPPSLKSQRLGARVRRWLLQRIARRRTVQLIAVSAAAAQYTIETLHLPENRVEVVLNGADLTRFLAIEPLSEDDNGPIFIASAGRLIPDKGFDTLIRAFSQVHAQSQTPQLLIAGKGSAEVSLQSLSQELGLENRVQFLGHVNDMPSFYAKSSIYVHASVAAEGLSRALIEAQASGRPVVTSEHPGAREAISENVTGMIVPANNPQAMAEAIFSLVSSPRKRVSMGHAARTRAAQDFTSERVTSQVIQVYERMLTTK